MQMIHRRLALAGAVACAALVVVTPLGASTANSYNVTNLVSNVPGEAPTTDPLLENAWGLTSSPTSPWWVADNGTGFSTLYTGAGARLSLEVKVDDNPTGAVFNGTAGAFGVVPGGTGRFLFATESGQLLAWPGSGDAVVTKDFSDESAVFKGLAIAAGP